MTDEIRLAFAHPDARAQASRDGTPPPDRISLRDYDVEVEIGAFQSERGATQRVRFNIVVEVRSSKGPLNDDVDRILSYDTITDAIHSELSSERLNLLETLAERIADYILTEPLALRVFVRIEKLDRGPGALGVEIVRQRPAETPKLLEDDPHHWVAPRVVFLTNAAIVHPDLSTWLDRLEQGEVPTILAVGPADQKAPQARHAMAQRRIDLLAIEQNAWVLAGRDPRCVVTDTRTEVDWATKHGQMIVWAPSKMVLDAVDGPSAQPRDTFALISWFATQVHACELVLLGAEPEGDADLTIRAIPLDEAAERL